MGLYTLEAKLCSRVCSSKESNGEDSSKQKFEGRSQI